MELFKVTLDYRAHELSEPGRVTEVTTRTQQRYVAVHGEFGASMVTRAAQAAIDAVIGPNCDMDRWQPIVHVVEYIGTVRIEKEAP